MYETLFETSWLNLKVYSFLVPFIMMIYVRHRYSKAKNGQDASWVIEKDNATYTFVILLLAAVLLMGVSGGLLYHNAKIIQTYKNGNFEVITGSVYKLNKTKKGNKPIGFRVAGKKFTFISNNIKPEFNDISKIEDGMPVRLSYKGNSIFKLETKVQ